MARLKYGMPEFVVPASLLASLERVPLQASAALLLRHAHRPVIPIGVDWNAVELSPYGVATAEALGRHLGARLVRIVSSPVRRCLQTAEALARGASVAALPVVDPRLGAGPFFADEEAQQRLLPQFTVYEYVDQLLRLGPPLPGMRSTAEGIADLVGMLTAAPDAPPGLAMFVTHDSVVAATAAYLLGAAIRGKAWPDFLEGICFWREGDRLVTAWRGARVELSAP